MSDVLHVGQAILDWMRDQPSQPAQPRWALPIGVAGLFGLPVTFDDTLPAGAWKLMRDGEPSEEGYIGTDGMTTAYVPHLGFISFAEPELPTPTLISIPDPGRTLLWYLTATNRSNALKVTDV